ncbi:hypothetical protein SAMN06295933_3257 [Desulfovibrio gilichinskyi]|uniref:Uncharacterized protein n=2 Tax=Desulfovibrio gilichinskyi TaxID=1519643 RepID=A0A1X7ER92_9BACT|nr:hypothetical protein SAMN06295933_3257 [Desulfovibrio gilichinskyi]
MTPEYGAQQPAVIASSTLAAPIVGEEIGAAGSVVAGRAAPYLEKAVRNSRNVINRANDVVKNARNKADIRIRNSKNGSKYEIGLDDILEAPTAFIDSIPPSIGKISGPLTAILGTGQVIDNVKQLYKEAKGKISDQKNK